MVLNRLNILVTAGEIFQARKTGAQKALVSVKIVTCSEVLELLLMRINMEDFSRDADDLK